MKNNHKIGFGGSCHWCSEAIFLSLRGVSNVEQGWLASSDDAKLSEAVIVHFLPEIISLDVLISVHVHSHSATAVHRLRVKYPSAIYCYNHQDIESAEQALRQLGAEFDQPVITKVVNAGTFKLSPPQYRNYYFKDPEKPFCVTRITPKLSKLVANFGDYVDHAKLSHLCAKNSNTN